MVIEAASRTADSSGERESEDRFARAPTEIAADDPLLGTDVGRYRITSLLGQGGMGRVYLACQPAIGSRVAVKILLDESARNPELMERFFAEARAVNLVNHEHIVNIVDLAQLPDGRPFIVMEYIEGETLSILAEDGPVALGGLVQVMREVLSALDAAHAIGIVHRDLKPDNVRVTVEGHAKVLDFGVAKLAPALQRQVSPRTRTGALLGTPHYMAPEQISGTGGIDARTDIYAAGVVLYELATGQKPFTGETLYDLMHAHLETPPRPPRALRPELPIALERVILKALEKRPDERYATAAEMSEALRVAASELPEDAWAPLSRGRARERSGPTVLAKGSARGSNHDVVPTVEASRSAPTVDNRRAGTTGNRHLPTAAMGPQLRTMRRRRAAWMIASGVTAAGAVAAWMLVTRAATETPNDVAKSTAETIAVPTSAEPAAAVATSPAPVSAAPDSEKISLQLAVEPRDAAVMIDGQAVIGSELELAKDTALHTLRISAPGYAVVEQRVRFDQSQRVMVHLNPLGKSPRTVPAPATPPAPTPARRERIEAKSPYD